MTEFNDKRFKKLAGLLKEELEHSKDLQEPRKLVGDLAKKLLRDVQHIKHIPLGVESTDPEVMQDFYDNPGIIWTLQTNLQMVFLHFLQTN